MRSQEVREFFYFSLPVFLMDLAVHICVLLASIYLLPEEQTIDIRELEVTSVLFLLSISYIAALALYPIQYHRRKMLFHTVLESALLQNILTYTFFILLLAVLFKVTPRYVIGVSFIVTLFFMIAVHVIAYNLVAYLRSRGHNTRAVVLAGVNEMTLRVYRELLSNHSLTGYRVKGFFTCNHDTADLPEGATNLGPIEMGGGNRWLQDNVVDEIYSSLDPVKYPSEVKELVQYANSNFAVFFFVPTFEGYPKHYMQTDRMGDVNVMRLRNEPLNSVFAQLFKRSVDIVISALFLCTIYPFVLLFVALGNIIFANRGPLYFRQVRTGYNGKVFKIYKFRSMRPSADADTKQATKEDPRKTRFGAFLRRSSIDELPQFINVLFGDMSIVGPRPHMEYHTRQYSELIGDYMVRHLAKPGITGWAQINGCRGETKTVEEMKARVEHDIWYIEHWSPVLDVYIFLKTISQAFLHKDEQAY